MNLSVSVIARPPPLLPPPVIKECDPAVCSDNGWMERMKEERIRKVEKVEVTGWEASLPSAPSSLRAQLTSPLREGGSYLPGRYLKSVTSWKNVSFFQKTRPGECVQRCYESSRLLQTNPEKVQL